MRRLTRIIHSRPAHTLTASCLIVPCAAASVGLGLVVLATRSPVAYAALQWTGGAALWSADVLSGGGR